MLNLKITQLQMKIIFQISIAGSMFIVQVTGIIAPSKWSYWPLLITARGPLSIGKRERHIETYLSSYSWQWKMAPLETKLIFQGIAFPVHDYGRKGIPFYFELHDVFFHNPSNEGYTTQYTGTPVTFKSSALSKPLSSHLQFPPQCIHQSLCKPGFLSGFVGKPFYGIISSNSHQHHRSLHQLS